MRMLGERAPDPSLGKAESVVRSRVEVADAERPGGVDRLARLLLGDLTVEVAELGAAERELAELQCGAGKPAGRDHRRSDICDGCGASRVAHPRRARGRMSMALAWAILMG